MVAGAEPGEHGAGIIFIARFAEDEAVAFGNGIGGNDDGRGFRNLDFGLRILGKLLVDCAGFAEGQIGNQACGARLAADAAFDIGGGRDDGEIVAGGFEQFASSRRTAGEDEAKGLGIGGWGLGWWHVTFLGVGGQVSGVGSRFSDT